jgi:hypothetical protein
MNAMLKAEVKIGLEKGIKLLNGYMQPIFAQCVDNTSLTLLGEEVVQCLIYTF